jgi:hypothetical protein
MDGAEFHGKWPYGGSPSWLGPFSYQQWLSEVPLQEHKSKQSWRGERNGVPAQLTIRPRPPQLTKTPCSGHSSGQVRSRRCDRPRGSSGAPIFCW